METIKNCLNKRKAINLRSRNAPGDKVSKYFLSSLLDSLIRKQINSQNRYHSQCISMFFRTFHIKARTEMIKRCKPIDPNVRLAKSSKWQENPTQQTTIPKVFNLNKYIYLFCPCCRFLRCILSTILSGHTFWLEYLTNVVTSADSHFYINLAECTA